jgi:hypothetical protein
MNWILLPGRKIFFLGLTYYGSFKHYLFSSEELSEVTIARKVLPKLGMNAIRKDN